MDYSKTLDIVNNFTDSLLSINKKIKDLNLDLDKCNQAQQDIVHEIEFTKFSSVDGYYLARKLKEIRQERRRIKNDITILTPMQTFYNKHASITNDIRALSENTKCKIANIENSHYRCKQIQGLKVEKL